MSDDSHSMPPAAAAAGFPAPDFRALFEAAPDLYMVLLPDSPRFTIVGASDAYLKSTLTVREQVMGRGLFDVFPDNPDDLAANSTNNLQASLERVLASRKAHVMALQKYDVPNPTGHGFVQKYWRPSNTPVFNARGELEIILHRAEDVTDTVLMEQREAANKVVLDTVLDSMPSGVIAVDMKNRVLINNAGAQAISRISSEDIPADSQDWPLLYGMHTPEGEPLDLADLPLSRALAGQTINNLELLIKNAHNGDGVFVDASARPLRDAQGQQTGAVVVFTDIDARKRTEQALRQSETRFRLMTDATPQVAWTAGPDGGIDFINRAGLAYFGHSFEALQGMGWMSALHPEDLQPTAENWGQSLASGQPVETQYRLRRHDGEYRWHIARGVADFDEDGRPKRWYGITTDIEDLRRAQAAAEAATEAKSQFLANMSHEIRTPMNGVIGMTSLLQATALDEAQREYVGIIRSSGEHLLALINDILDFSKAEAGKLDLEHYIFDLRGCVEEAMELVAASANKKNLELILETTSDLPRHITGDAGRLRQILVNLLSNAIKFTAAGEVLVRVSVSVRPQADGSWRLRFAVQDSGIGIPPERMDRLFGVFSQVDPSHTRTYGGSGLGLAICRRLVERMGGRIWAESAAGQGSTFCFEIEARMAPEDIAPTPVSFDSKCVLVVDDNATNRRVLRLMLESWGLEVVDVAEPLSALRLASQQKFDVALLDFQMPHMTGVKLAHIIRSLPACASLPLMLLGSLSSDDETVDNNLFSARMLKPVRQSTLFDQLAILFGHIQRTPIHSNESDAIQPAEVRPLRILVAEDNSVNQKVALRFLEKLGYTADLAANGFEAVLAVERQHYDVVLMDVQMPEMDGFEATRIIRSRAVAGPRIIAVTANALSGDEQRCREAGMDDYLTKPLDIRELAAALTRTPYTPPESGQAPASSEPETFELSSDTDFRPDVLARLEQIFEADGARELIEAMANDLPTQQADFALGLRQRDPVRTGRVIHTFKGTSLMLGAEGLGALCEEVELAFRKGDFDRAAQGAADISRRYAALIERLQRSLPT